MRSLLNRLTVAFGDNSVLCKLAAREIKILRKYITISQKEFVKLVGDNPVDDELDRVNCSKRGTGHDSCGWCIDCNAPYYICGGKHK